MKYKITVSGYGCDAIIHTISEEQLETFTENNVSDGEMTNEEICDVLELDSIYDSDDIVNGLYFDNEELINTMEIVVEDEDGNEVWKSDKDFSFDYDTFETTFHFYDDNYFIVESMQKGQFRIFDLETEEFNPKLLTPVVVELLDGAFELITSLHYDGEELDGDFGDTRNTGDNYSLFEA